MIQLVLQVKCRTIYLIYRVLFTNIDPCEMSRDIGDCSDSETRVYYDMHKKQCFAFQYTGCGGNANNFKDFSECSSTCGKPNAWAV